MAKKTLTKKKTKTKKELISVTDKSEVLVIPKITKEVTVFGTPGAGDQLSLYLKQIRKYELLSPEQEEDLTRALEKTGDVEVAKKLVLHNLRLVVKIAMEYRSSYQNVMDLIQEGNFGLMKAVSMYDGS